MKCLTQVLYVTESFIDLFPKTTITKIKLWSYRAVTHFKLLRPARLGHDKVLDGQVDVSRAVRADLLVTLNQLIQLQAHEACHRGCRGSYGRDDPSGNALTLQRWQWNVHFHIAVSCSGKKIFQLSSVTFSTILTWSNKYKLVFYNISLVERNLICLLC